MRKSLSFRPAGAIVSICRYRVPFFDTDAMGVSREVLSEYGNMSSATLLFILERLRRQGAERPCVAVGFGPGMVVETMLLT